jgi:hypothetical protein
MLQLTIKTDLDAGGEAVNATLLEVVLQATNSPAILPGLSNSPFTFTSKVALPHPYLGGIAFSGLTVKLLKFME